ncbi:hypothetical protein [Nitrospirillum sp. BR 11828]|uniref:hypothetical protein n=1 Tax=Nitrospirillum sp. BR 11828 TaxID=3104325 RepID=UPI002ACA8E5E|nr:hypothetical protein [Nitrospirillum sp. BR 11828]MDZ5648570.1 hypothetical protein [Nitrospirillum sp. BR 11828]
MEKPPVDQAKDGNTPGGDDPGPAPETPKPPEVRHLKETDLSEEARQRLYACLAAPPSPHRSNTNRWQSMPRRRKLEPG